MDSLYLVLHLILLQGPARPPAHTDVLGSDPYALVPESFAFRGQSDPFSVNFWPLHDVAVHLSQSMQV